MSCQSCSGPYPANDNTVPTNNKFSGCPPRMADGRNFTDYRPRCYQQYVVDNKLMSSFEQRMYLTQNAEDLMKQGAAMAYMNNRCGPCEEPFDVGTMLPEMVQQVCNDKTCTFNVTNPYGLGLGRQYILDDQDQAFRAQFLAEKEKEQSYFKQNNVDGHSTDPLYYPIDGMVTTQYDRYAVPSGAVPLTGGQ